MAIKMTHIDHTVNTTTIIECENINTLKELGYMRIVPKMSISAEKAYFGNEHKGINIKLCQQVVNCVDCDQFIECNNLERWNK